MKNITYIISSLFIFLALTSCEPSLEYEGEPIENFIVINTLLKADSVISCRISRSYNIFKSDTIQSIVDATIKLYENGLFLQVLSGDGKGNYYTSPKIKALIGCEYTVEVEHSKYKSVKATTQILEKPHVRLKTMEYEGGYYNSKLFCKLEIVDPKGEDYYRLRLYVPELVYNSESKDYDFKEPIDYNLISVESKDPVLNYNLIPNDDNYSNIPLNQFQVFDDLLFDGGKYELTFFIKGKFNTGYAIDQLYLRNKFLNTIKLEVQRIEKDVFRYFTTVEASKYYMDDSFVEPVKVHSNVEGGAGIFGAVTSSVVYYEP